MKSSRPLKIEPRTPTLLDLPLTEGLRPSYFVSSDEDIVGGRGVEVGPFLSHPVRSTTFLKIFPTDPHDQTVQGVWQKSTRGFP